MAWSWSHTEEAYVNAREQLEALPREERNVIAAEWLAAKKTSLYGEPEFLPKRYQRALLRVARWSDDKINEWVWERVERLATCTNGGWRAWVCPWGCHQVPFDPVTEEAVV
jgi:hypothetical protein